MTEKPTIRELLDTVKAGAPDAVDAALAERVERVLALHTRTHEYGQGKELCMECLSTHPCATVRLLNGEEP